MKTAARVVALVVLARWTILFLVRPMRQDVIGASFLHLVSIPFHEAGHILLAPFGPLVTALGGSVAQVLVPAVCAVAFLTTSFDPFAAALCVWWTGENLLDVALYINDARALNLVLLGGHTGAEVDGHDWEQVLQSLGALHLDHRIALIVQAAGVALMAGSFAAGAWITFAGAGDPASAARSPGDASGGRLSDRRPGPRLR